MHGLEGAAFTTKFSQVKKLVIILLLIAVAFAAWLLWPRPAPPPLIGRIDHILIEKSARRLTVFHKGKALRSYDIALGFTPVGDKKQEGDGKTPEGRFTIDRRNPNSAFHLSLGIDYPRPEHRAAAAQSGIDPGGDIFIHGQPNKLKSLLTIPYDWTAGCIALSNAEMEELWRTVPIGTSVEITP